MIKCHIDVAKWQPCLAIFFDLFRLLSNNFLVLKGAYVICNESTYQMPLVMAEKNATEVVVIFNNPMKSAFFKLRYKAGKNFIFLKWLFDYSIHKISSLLASVADKKIHAIIQKFMLLLTTLILSYLASLRMSLINWIFVV